MSKPEIECRQPKVGEEFRVKPDEYRDAVLARDEDGTYYMIGDNMLETAEKRFPDRLEYVTIYIAMNKDAETFLWPIPRPVPSDHPVHAAMRHWISIDLVHPMPKRMQ